MLITGLYQPILCLADRFFIRINKDFIIIVIITNITRSYLHFRGPVDRFLRNAQGTNWIEVTKKTIWCVG